MVASNDTIQESANPQTCCTNCQTVFEIPQELLASQDTRVRCGECLCIFDAMDGLSLPETAILAPAHGSATDSGKSTEVDSAFSDLDVTYSDFDLFSEDAALPEVVYLDETGEPVELDFDSVDTEGDRTFSDTMFKHDVTINADIPIDATREPADTEALADGDDSAVTEGTERNLTESGLESGLLEPRARVRFDDAFSDSVQVPNEPLIFEYHDPGAKTDIPEPEPVPVFDVDDMEKSLASDLIIDPSSSAPDGHVARVREPAKSGSRSLGRWFLGGLLIVGLMTLMLGLYGYQERARLANDPRTRPIMAATCVLLRCELPERFAPDQLRVLGRHVYSHPDIADALVVNVVFRNEADFDQRYPILIIKLSDISGKLVASRDFQPAEYLSQEMLTESSQLAARTSLDISLEIRDPGANASSFEMDFR